jgi:guanine deaminase
MQPQAQFMRMAIELATDNALSGQGGPFAAVIVRDGELVATGVNQVTTANDPTAHGEIMAIRNACKALATFDLSGCDIYSSCEPCPMCMTAIYWARCSNLYFGNTASDAAEAGFDDSHLYEEIRKPMNERELPSQNLLRTEALASFNAWRAYSQRVDY